MNSNIINFRSKHDINFGNKNLKVKNGLIMCNKNV